MTLALAFIWFISVVLVGFSILAKNCSNILNMNISNYPTCNSLPLYRPDYSSFVNPKQHQRYSPSSTLTHFTPLTLNGCWWRWSSFLCVKHKLQEEPLSEDGRAGAIVQQAAGAGRSIGRDYLFWERRHPEQGWLHRLHAATVMHILQIEWSRPPIVCSSSRVHKIAAGGRQVAWWRGSENAPIQLLNSNGLQLNANDIKWN